MQEAVLSQVSFHSVPGGRSLLWMEGETGEVDLRKQGKQPEGILQPGASGSRIQVSIAVCPVVLCVIDEGFM